MRANNMHSANRLPGRISACLLGLALLAGSAAGADAVEPQAAPKAVRVAAPCSNPIDMANAMMQDLTPWAERSRIESASVSILVELSPEWEGAKSEVRGGLPEFRQSAERAAPHLHCRRVDKDMAIGMELEIRTEDKPPSATDRKLVSVVLESDGALYLNQRQIPARDEMRQALRAIAKQPESPVIIWGVPEGSIDRLKGALADLHQAGLGNIAFDRDGVMPVQLVARSSADETARAVIDAQGHLHLPNAAAGAADQAAAKAPRGYVLDIDAAPRYEAVAEAIKQLASPINRVSVLVD